MSRKTKKTKNNPWKNIQPVIGSNYGVDEKGRIFKKKNTNLFQGPFRSQYIPQKSMSGPKVNQYGQIIHNNRKSAKNNNKGEKNRIVCTRMVIPQRVPVQITLKGKDKNTKEDVSIKVKLNKEKVIYHTRAFTGEI